VTVPVAAEGVTVAVKVTLAPVSGAKNNMPRIFLLYLESPYLPAGSRLFGFSAIS
jgi:hypothetical protein